MRTSARTAPCRSTMLLCDQLGELLDDARLAEHGVADRLVEQLGEARHVNALLSAPRSTVHSISAAMVVSASPRRILIAFWTPVTPARDSASSTGGEDACMSSTSCGRSAIRRNVAGPSSTSRMPVRSLGMDSRLYLTVNRFVVDHDAIGGIFAFLETWAVPLFAAATVGLWFLDRPGARRKWKLASASALALGGLRAPGRAV